MIIMHDYLGNTYIVMIYFSACLTDIQIYQNLYIHVPLGCIFAHILNIL